MINKKMEILRSEINEMIISEDFDRDKLVAKSKELDILIIEAMRDTQGTLRKSFIAKDEMIDDIREFLSKLTIFSQSYEVVRIVDPISKKVHVMKKNKLYETDMICYKSKTNERACENCVSIRAFYEENTLFKIECKEGQVSMLTAVPIKVKDKRVVVEFTKQITNSLSIGNKYYEKGIRIFSLIDQINRDIVKDKVTGVFNQRYINERFPVDFLAASVSGEPLCILYATIEQLPEINELYGHSAGELVAKEFSRELMQHSRKGKDWVARYNSQVFLVCFPNMTIETAREIAEKIRRNTNGKIFKIDEGTAYITCTFEVSAVCNDNSYKTLDEMVELANKQLEEIKHIHISEVI